jgi:hypothetical protein
MTAAELEVALCQAYREQTELYGQALDLVRAPRTGAASDWVQNLLGLLDQIGVIDGRLAAARQRWQESRAQPGPELRGLIVRIAAQIQEIAHAVSQTQTELLARRLQLLPEFDQLARQERMRRAYARTAEPAGSEE